MNPDGRAIRAEREAQRLSLRVLSARTGLERGYLSRLERGQIQHPDAQKVRVIAEALGVPTAVITRGDGDVTTATKNKRPSTAEGDVTSLDELVHYSPEEVYERGWLPFKPRTLRDKANARQIPHSCAGGRISFTLRHIRETAAMYEVRPISESKSR